MATIAQLKSGISTNLKTISGLRSSDTIPEQVNPPFAIVALSSVDYDTTFRRGLDTYTFNVTVVVGRADARTGQNALDVYCAPTGTYSVKTAIELDRSLGGVANDVRVTGLSNYGNLTIGETNYLAAEWAVTVIA